MAVYDPLQLVTELTAAGLPVEGVDATGRAPFPKKPAFSHRVG